ncbi:hypothetical protein AMECASPLE_002547 [Ameca splendens]|uniref:Uncharacterized protein n=1 Tax=Ameca splendens TaxID=208324 RepID=A0ABV0YKC8_9TELE
MRQCEACHSDTRHSLIAPECNPGSASCGQETRLCQVVRNDMSPPNLTGDEQMNDREDRPKSKQRKNEKRKMMKVVDSCSADKGPQMGHQTVSSAHSTPLTIFGSASDLRDAGCQCRRPALRAWYFIAELSLEGV